MCMLCVVPPNVLPSREKLENSALNNPDGFGFAIVIAKEKRILVERTMDADESINRFLEMRAKYPEGYALWHARLATHGSVDVSNCHPFAVGNNGYTILAHNGVLPTIEKTADKRSDTRIFAEDILARIGGAPALDNDQIWNMIEDFSSGSKICVLTIDPRAKYQMYLMHEDKGKYDESKVWWSNDTCTLTNGYLYRGSSNAWSYYDDYAYWGNTASKTKDSCEADNLFACSVCGGLSSDDEMEKQNWVCKGCNACQWCETNANACLCYKKSERKYLSTPTKTLNEKGEPTW